MQKITGFLRKSGRKFASILWAVSPKNVIYLKLKYPRLGKKIVDELGSEKGRAYSLSRL